MAASCTTLPIPAFQGFQDDPIVDFKGDKEELAEIIRELTQSQDLDIPSVDLSGHKIEVIVLDEELDSPPDENSLSIVLDQAPLADGKEEPEITDDGFVLVSDKDKAAVTPQRVYTVTSAAYAGADLVVKVVKNKAVQDTAIIAGTFLFTGPVTGTFVLAGKCAPLIAKTVLWTVLPWPVRTALKTAEVCDRNKILFNGGLIAWTFATRGLVAGSLATVKEVGYRWIAARVALIAALFF